MLSARLHRGPGAFAALNAEWNRLVSESVTNTPFQLWGYQQSWWRNLGSGELITVEVRDGQGELAALGVFFVDNGVVRFNGCTEETDYLDLIAPGRTIQAAWELVLDCLMGEGTPDWDTMDLCNIPAASPTLAMLPSLALVRGLSHSTELHEICPVIELPASFDAYLASLEKKQRHEIRRKLRRSLAAGAEVRIVAKAEELPESVDAFLHLLRRSTPEKDEWLDTSRENVFHEVAVSAFESGNLMLMFLEFDGENAAVLYNFDYADRIWVYNSGLEPTKYGHLSPGVVLTAQAIRQAIESGRSEFDFLRGQEQYKYRFGARDTTVHRVLLSKS